MTANEARTLRTAAGAPDLTAMTAALEEAATLASTEIDNMARDQNTRYAWWTDQQDNGRKPDIVNGREAAPWPGASDARIRLADELINYDVKVMKAAARRAKLTVRGTESGDMRDAGKVQLYLEHLRDTRLRRNYEREGELAAQYRQMHGKSLTAITWHQEYAREFVTLERATLEQAALAAAQSGQPDQGASIVLAALDPAADPSTIEQALALAEQMFPDSTAQQRRQALADLGTEGTASLPQRYLRLNEPRREALKLWHDVWLPTNTEDLQRSPWIAWRRTFTPSEVMEKQVSEGWDEDFCDRAVETVGRTILELVSTDQQDSSRRQDFRDQEEEMQDRVEVFYVYHTYADDQDVPCKHLTVMSPHVVAASRGRSDDAPVAIDQALDYDHGLYPFVAHRRENIGRQLIASRGVPEIVMTQQAEVKHTRDARVNQTDLVLQPPVIRPEREIGLPISLRPRGEVGERRQNSTRMMVLPNTAPAGQPLEAEAQRDALRYFGRLRGEDPALAALMEQDLADDFCSEEADVWRHTLKLAQQYEEDMTFQRIVGGQPSRIRLTRAEIQGEYDLRLYYNTDALDPERMKAKVELYSKFLLPNSNGEIDTAPITRGLMSYYFPEFADVALRGTEQVTAKEVEDEELNWTRMVGNIEPAMKESGQNFQLRMQWLQSQVGKPESQQLLQQLPYLEQLVSKRMEHLSFMVEQKTTNAQTGRVGVQAG